MTLKQTHKREHSGMCVTRCADTKMSAASHVESSSPTSTDELALGGIADLEPVMQHYGAAVVTTHPKQVWMKSAMKQTHTGL